MATIEFSGSGAILHGETNARFQEFFDRHAGSSAEDIKAAWAKEFGGRPSEAIVASINKGEATAGGL